MNFTVGVDSNPESAREAVLAGLRRYNEGFLGPSRSHPLVVAARNEAGAVVGGAVGGVWRDRLVIDYLWVEESLRGTGLGTRVLRGIEAEAILHGATRVYLDTFTFQAAPFYEKNGYTEVARIRDFWDGCDRIYLAKELEAALPAG